MSMIKVRTVKGRVAYDKPRGGKRISNDEFVPVTETPYIRRLIDFHGDLEVEKEKAKSIGSTPKE